MEPKIWTAEEIAKLTEMSATRTTKEIAAVLCRTHSSVISKASKLHILCAQKHDVGTLSHESRAKCDGEYHLCHTCGLRKSLGEFPRDPRVVCGRTVECTLCGSSKAMFRRNGIILLEFTWLYGVQGFGCICCEEDEDGIDHAYGTNMRLTIDHDHSCIYHGERKTCRRCIRGILCSTCNKALGNIEKRPHSKFRNDFFEWYIKQRPFWDLEKDEPIYPLGRELMPDYVPPEFPSIVYY